MHNFARALTLNRAIPQLAHRRGVVRLQEMDSVQRAAAIVRDAEQEAEDITCTARKEAQAMQERHRREIDRQRDEALRAAEESVWKQAIAYHEALERQFHNFTAVLEEQALPVVRKAITTLAHEMPPEQRIAVCVRSLLDEVGRPADSTLYVNEQDQAALQDLRQPLAWPVAVDNGLAPGSCRLVSQRGEWRSAFDGRLERLLSVFDLSCRTAEQASEETEVEAA